MRRNSLVFVTLVFVTLALVAISLSTVSFAADQYSYRAGQPYMRTTANSHTECEAQCRGNAACQGWNFIRPNPRSYSGICEFNARQAAPVSSPISISGEISARVEQAMNRAVPTTRGNTSRSNTSRGSTASVGRQMMSNRDVKRVVANRPVAVPQIANASRNDYRNAPKNVEANLKQRIVQRVPAEQNIRAPIPAGYRLLVPARETNVSPIARIRTAREPLPQAQLQPFTGSFQPRSMTRQQIYNEQMCAARKRAEVQAKIQVNAQIQQAQYRAVSPPRLPQQSAPKMQQAPRAPQITRTPQQIVRAPQQIVRAPQISRAQPPSVQMPPKTPTAVPNQQSLYGSLYDDLTQNMTPVPRPQTAPDQIGNPDAPIATSRIIPAMSVPESSFSYPMIAGLAGG